MKMTVLEMVQNIASALETDEITSILDTAESEAIATVLKETFYQMVSNTMIPEHYELSQLTSAGGTAKVFMEIPDGVSRIEWLKYNKIEDGGTDAVWSEVRYLPPETFMSILLQRKSSDTNVVSATDPTSAIAMDMFQNDAPPTYWTSFDDHYICFDSYDVAVDASGLVASKTMCWSSIFPTWTDNDDDFIPDMDDHLFPFLLAEAKSLCFVNMKQSPNAKVEKQANRQRYSLQNDKFRTKSSAKAGFAPTGPNYGRVARGR